VATVSDTKELKMRHVVYAKREELSSSEASSRASGSPPQRCDPRPGSMLTYAASCNAFEYGRYMWAASVVKSRSFFVSAGEGLEPVPVLVPVADVFNLHNDVRTDVSMDPDTKVFRMKTLQVREMYLSRRHASTPPRVRN
jgi:hypothetical protein